MKIRIIIFCLITSCLCLNLRAELTVTARGQAVGSGRIVKEQALADALRNAIRKGAGINLISSSRTSDYVLDFDRIFSRAFGYVKEFRVISSGYDDAGIYTLEISAVIGKAQEKMNDYLAMRQIISLKGSPRLLIRAAGKINDIGDTEKLIAGQLREIALQCGFQTLKIDQLAASEARHTERDKLLGQQQPAAYYASGIRNNYDFVIDVEITGSYNGKSSLYGIPAQRFSLGADLSAAYPGGNAIAQLTVPGKDIDIAQISGKVPAARAALHKLLGDEKGRNFRALLLRILAAWLSEFDTGSKITLELPGGEQEAFMRIVDGLKQAGGINAVHVRQFDARLKSFIEVESNLKNYDLAALVSSLSEDRLKAVNISNDYIRMQAADSNVLPGKRIIVLAVAATAVLLLLLLIFKNLKAAKASGNPGDRHYSDNNGTATGN
ncbi:MAG: hypothetical protein PHV59_09915 [Victivallales bacterium]|nr:hypothetical protein [Victivallales bacterium]